MTETLECCVCYTEKSLYSNCGHVLCTDCFSKLNSLSCPICRTQIKCLLIEKPTVEKPKVKKPRVTKQQGDIIEVEEYNNGLHKSTGRKTIMMSNLKRYLFSNAFKNFLDYKLSYYWGRDMPFSNYMWIHTYKTRHIILKEPFDKMTTETLLLLLLSHHSISNDYRDNQLIRKDIYSILLSRSKQFNLIK